MNLPTGTASQGTGVASAQFEFIARVGKALMRFANDLSVDAHATRQNPFFGAASRCVRMLPQQPFQQRFGLSFDMRQLGTEADDRRVTKPETRVCLRKRGFVTEFRLTYFAAAGVGAAAAFPGMGTTCDSMPILAQT